MKKISLVLALFVISTSVFSQNVQFGIKAGVNFADMNDDAAPDNTKSRTSYHAGLLAHIHLSKMFAIQPEVVYSSQGAEYTLANFNGETHTRYINVPVLVQYMTSSGLRIQTGPQVGFLNGAKFHPNGNGPVTEIPNTNNVDFSWAFGAGYLTPVGIGIDARYNLGLSNTYESSSPKSQNRVLQVGLFYQFGK